VAVSDGTQGFFEVITEQREPASQAKGCTVLAGICFYLLFIEDLLNGIRRISLVWNYNVRQFMVNTLAVLTLKPTDNQYGLLSV
jgi:hypothetical protein